MNRISKEKVRCLILDSHIAVVWCRHAIEYAAYDELHDIFEEEGYQALRDLRRDQPYLDIFLPARFREARKWGGSHGRK